jgi:hypothetical protein
MPHVATKLIKKEDVTLFGPEIILLMGDFCWEAVGCNTRQGVMRFWRC